VGSNEWHIINKSKVKELMKFHNNLR